MEVSRKYVVKTDKKGRYFHTSVNIQDRYRIVAEKEGYQATYVQGARPAFGTKQRRGVIDFVLMPGKRGHLDFELTDEQREEFRKKQEQQIRQQKISSELALLFNAGVKAFNGRNFEEALTAFRKAARLDPENGDVWDNVGATYSNLKEYDRSIAAYETALKFKTDKSNLYQKLGNIYSSKGNQDKAKEYWEKAAGLGMTRDPEEAAISYYNLGVTYINSGRNIEAIEALRKTIEHNPKYSEAHYQLGLTLLGTNQIKDGVSHLKKYLKLSPKAENAETAKALIEELDK